MKRVSCLYRVLTAGQVDHDDIPMQRLACREFVKQHPDWVITNEIAEEGVSGYKISASKRDAILELQCDAHEGKYDILLVFMFDRIGRKDDETPFVVEGFVKLGIEVWSVKEGQQRFDTHVDKLMNYLRYWQASGESEKTAVRISTKHAQMVQDGIYRGGRIPYGYKLVKNGRKNKKGYDVNDIAIDEDEARIIRLIFSKMIDEGLGTHRMANLLNDMKVPTREGTHFWCATGIRAIIVNRMYTGRMHFGDLYSDPFEEYRIISDEDYDRVQALLRARTPNGGDGYGGLRTDGALLSGLLVCGHCGHKLAICNIIDKRRDKNNRRHSYRCYGKFDNMKACDGQFAYVMEHVDDAVLDVVHRVLARFKNRQTPELFNALMQNIRAAANVKRKEMVQVLMGTSSVPKGLPARKISERREEIESSKTELAQIMLGMTDERIAMEKQIACFERYVNWADAFDELDPCAQKMVLIELIDKVTITRGYNIKVTLNVTVQELLDRLDERDRAG